MLVYINKKHLAVINTLLEDANTKESRIVKQYLEERFKKEKRKLVKKERRRYLKKLGYV